MRPVSPLLLSLGTVLVTSATAAAARADGALPAESTPVQREQAQSRFLRGKDLMNKRDQGGALSEFRASHEIVASPNTRLEIARCLTTMGKLVEAYAEFGRTAVEAKEMKAEDNRYERAYDAAIAERAQLQPRLGFVSLTIENAAEGTRVAVGGEEIRRAAWAEPAPVLAGTAEIVVRTPGHAAVARSMALAPGGTAALTIDAQSGAPDTAESPVPIEPKVVEAPSGPHLRTWAYVAGGIGGAGLATFAIFGAMAHSTYGDLQGACGAGPCPPAKADEVSSGRGQQTLANIGLAVGIIGAASGATLFVLSIKKNNPPATGAAVILAPAWIGVRGTL